MLHRNTFLNQVKCNDIGSVGKSPYVSGKRVGLLIQWLGKIPGRGLADRECDGNALEAGSKLQDY